jgi:hypothetical protein
MCRLDSDYYLLPQLIIDTVDDIVHVVSVSVFDMYMHSPLDFLSGDES